MFDQAASACDTGGDDTDTSRKLNNEALDVGGIADTAQSVQNLCEAVALIATALSYLLLVLRNLAVYRRAEHVATTALLSLADRTEHGNVSVPAVFADSDYTGAADATVQLARASAVQVAEDLH
jgi:hypothetical protein